MFDKTLLQIDEKRRRNRNGRRITWKKNTICNVLNLEEEEGGLVEEEESRKKDKKEEMCFHLGFKLGMRFCN